MLRRLIAIGATAAVIAGALVSPALAQSNNVTVNADGVSVRKGPSTSHARIKTVSKGATATVLTREGSWAKLKFSDGTVGYVRRDFLSSRPSSSQTPSSKVWIKGDGVSVRKGPSTSTARITTVNSGTSAAVLSREGEWAKLQFPGGTVGYVRRDLLTSSPPASSSANHLVRTKTTVNVRKGPSTETAKVATVAQDAIATVVGTDGNWAKLKFPGGTIGYVRRDLLDSIPSDKPTYSVNGEKINYISTAMAKINSDNVIVRKDASTNAKKITQVSKGTMVTVLDRQGAWYQVRFPHGTVGYVRGDLLNPVTRTVGSGRSAAAEYVAMKSAPKLSIDPSDVLVVAEAKRMLGTPYVWASESSRGVDCSGLAYYLYQKFEGVTLPRTSREMVEAGTPVSKENVSPGDLLFFRTRGSSRINHVGIYIGNGKFIHSSRSRGGVVIGDCNSGYYQTRLAAIRRIKSNLKTVGGDAKPSSSKTAQSKPPKSGKTLSKKPSAKPQPSKPKEP